MANDRLGGQDLLSMVLQSDIDKIRLTLEELDRTSFDQAVDAIVSARKIYIIGVRCDLSLPFGKSGGVLLNNSQDVSVHARLLPISS